MNEVIDISNLQVCFEWQVTAKIEKPQKKNGKKKSSNFSKKPFQITRECLGSVKEDAEYEIQRYCQEKKFKLLELISIIPTKVAFAYYKNLPDYPFVEDELKKKIPLPIIQTTEPK